jgi:hypothetical protein
LARIRKVGAFAKWQRLGGRQTNLRYNETKVDLHNDTIATISRPCRLCLGNRSNTRGQICPQTLRFAGFFAGGRMREEPLFDQAVYAAERIARRCG